jgi:hypothetical protein
MSTLEQIKDDVKRLSKVDQETLLNWMTNLWGDELELTDAFKAEIERGEAASPLVALELFGPIPLTEFCHD